jgi:hypothetical protein
MLYLIFFAICLSIFIFPLSFSLPFIHPFCCYFIVFCYVLFPSFISLYSIFYALIPSVYLAFVYLTSYVPSVFFISIFVYFVTSLSIFFVFSIRMSVYSRRVCTLSSYASHSCAKSTIPNVKEQPVVITDVSCSSPLLGQAWKVEG